MFELSDQSCKVVSVSIGSELHGEERVSACYIDVSMAIGAEILDEISSGLRGVFYVKPRQAKLEGTEEDGPRLRFDGLLLPLRLKKEYAGYKARIVWGDLASSIDIPLIDTKLKKFVIDPQSGGSCSLSLQVQAHPDQAGYGMLAMVVQKDVKLTLEAPKADANPDAPKEPEAPKQ